MMLAVDRLTAEELRSIDAYEQIGHLNALFGEVKRCGDEKRAAIDAFSSAKIAALSDNSVPAKALVIQAKGRLDKATVSISIRKEQIRVLQTLLRAVPA